MKRLMVLFALSGAAGLVYEVVWFQLLRLTIGTGTQSLGLLLACFMGGLFVGSLGYARVVPAHWNPLRTYACIELTIAAIGAAMPFLVSWVRAVYLEHATSAGMAMALRTLICAGLLLPPTVLMGATLPALARWVRAGEKQAASIGRLYATNLFGAVAGTLGSALLLLPALGVGGANLVAVGMNLLVAAVAVTMDRSYTAPRTTEGQPWRSAGVT